MARLVEVVNFHVIVIIKIYEQLFGHVPAVAAVDFIRKIDG